MQIRIATEEEKQLAFALRFEVFVYEQNVPAEIEIDEEDDYALHFIAEEDDIIVGCARLILSETDAHIGRLAVKKIYRGKNVGSEICRFIIEYCRNQGYTYIWLNGQLQASEFYKKLGFKPEGEIFLDAGIEHTKMTMNI